MLTALLTASLAASAQVASAADAPRHLVSVDVDAQNIDAFRELSLDVLHIDADGADVLVSEAELAQLLARGLPSSVMIEDLAAYYANRLAAPPSPLPAGSLGAWLSPQFGQGGMGGYYTFPEIESVLGQMQAAYPSLITTRQSIGQTLGNRNLWMVKISDNPGVDENEPEVRVDAMHHAREPEGMQCTLWFMLSLLEGYGSDPLATYLVDEREIYFIPCVNPDGYEYNRQTNPGGGGLWRKNRRNNGGGSFGVDLNRNYPFNWGFDNLGSSSDPNNEVYRGPGAQSELEIQGMVGFISGRSFETALSVHTFGGVWLSPWGYDTVPTADAAIFDEIGALATEVNGYTAGPAASVLYLANGVTIDYDYGVHDTLSWTPEIGLDSDGFWPAQSRIVPLAQDNLLGFQRTALAAGTWVRAQALDVADAGDGDGFFEGSENVDITATIRNSGRRASGVIALSLSSSSPDVVITRADASVTGLAPFTDGQNAIPLAMQILPGTPGGTRVPFTVTVTDAGYAQTFDGEFIVGVEVVVAEFDFEPAGNQGWGVGNPNDASTGEWERGNPRGTLAQPEDDHTAGGNQCWFTGQGSVGGSLGENDVDSGSTTLVSPLFDLGGATAPRVSYWRWFSNNQGAAPAEDVFQIDLSNDGGSSWVAAEVVGPAGAQAGGGWFESSLDVASILTPTSQMRVRFIASDLGSGSIVEAALDDLRVLEYEDGDGCGSVTSYCVASANSVGAGAAVGASGTAAIGLDNFVLEVNGALPSGFGLFYYGETQIQATFGDGFRCVGGQTYRLQPPAMANGSGFASRMVDFSAPPVGGGGPGAILPLSTWNFQFWYRDPMGPGGSGFNLSDGLSVTFCP